MSDVAHAHALPPPTAQQFDDAIQQQDASILGMWVFLVTEILFFGGLFCAYAVYRWLYPSAFARRVRAVPHDTSVRRLLI